MRLYEEYKELSRAIRAGDRQAAEMALDVIVAALPEGDDSDRYVTCEECDQDIAIDIDLPAQSEMQKAVTLGRAVADRDAARVGSDMKRAA